MKLKPQSAIFGHLILMDKKTDSCTQTDTQHVCAFCSGSNIVHKSYSGLQIDEKNINFGRLFIIIVSSIHMWNLKMIWKKLWEEFVQTRALQVTKFQLSGQISKLPFHFLQQHYIFVYVFIW